jgi:hypothetical protein
VALPVLLVLGLVAVVAVASTGSTSRGSNTTRPPAEALLDMFFTLGLVALVAGGVLFVYGLTQRKAIAREVSTGKYRSSMFGWVVLAIVYVAVWHFRPKNFAITKSDPEIEDPLPGPQTIEPGSQQQPDSTYQPSVSWLALALVAALLIAGIALYVSSRRQSRTRPLSRLELAAQLAFALDEGLDDLHAEADPRRAIIAAYARLERVLAASGVPRRPAETAQEYVPRVLGTLALDPRAIERLTSLFTQAKFSLHEVDAGMKEDAIQALEQVRDELRRAAEESERTSDDQPVAAGATS